MSEMSQGNSGEAFIGNAKTFIDPSAELGLTGQLSFMSDFWARFNRQVPALSGDQEAALEQTLAQNPGTRVLPTPLLGYAARKDFAGQAKQIVGEDVFHDHYGVLWTPHHSTRYSRLLKDPEATVVSDDRQFALLYKTPEDTLAGRAAYIASLESAGQAVRADDTDTVWVFPVLDLHAEAPRQKEAATSLYQEIDPTVVPETLIAMQLLRRISDPTEAEDTGWEVDFANEAVYEVADDGAPMALAGIAGVRWRQGHKQIRLNTWPAGYSREGFGVLSGTSGIGDV